MWLCPQQLAMVLTMNTLRQYFMSCLLIVHILYFQDRAKAARGLEPVILPESFHGAVSSTVHPPRSLHDWRRPPPSKASPPRCGPFLEPLLRALISPGELCPGDLIAPKRLSLLMPSTSAVQFQLRNLGGHIQTTGEGKAKGNRPGGGEALNRCLRPTATPYTHPAGR